MDFSSGIKGKSPSYLAKQALAATSLFALGATFEVASKYAKDLQEEIADWEEGFTFSLGVLPDGPYMTARKEDGGIRFLGMGQKNADVSVLFKNLDCAVMVFTAQIGTHIAAAQKRFIVRGNLTQAMQLNRGMAITQTYLFPQILLDMTYKRPPKLTIGQKITKARIMSMLTPKAVEKLVRERIGS